MPLQQINLDQSIYQKPPWKKEAQFSPFSEALTPQEGSAGRTGSSSGAAPRSMIESARERGSRQAKANKEEEQRWRDYYEEVGRRATAKHEAEQERYRQISMRREEHQRALQLAKAGATPELTKENMPEMAMEVWKFISTLEPEGQKHFIQQLKQKEQPTGGFIESGGKRKEMPGSLGIYGHLVDKGLIDPKTDTIIKQTGEQEWYYNADDNLMYNRATGETKTIEQMGDKDWDVIYKDIIKEALDQTSKQMSETFLEGLSPKERNEYVLDQKREMEAVVASRLWQAGMRDATKIKNWASAAVGQFDWEGALETEKEKPEEEKTDKEKVSGLVELFKEHPEEMDKYDKYSDQVSKEEWDEAKSKLEKEEEPSVTTKTTEEEVEEEEEKSKVPKVKDYFNKYKSL